METTFVIIAIINVILVLVVIEQAEKIIRLRRGLEEASRVVDMLEAEDE